MNNVQHSIKAREKAADLMAKFPIKKALEVADKNVWNAKSDVQEEFWMAVAETIVMACTDDVHRHGGDVSECPTCGDVL